MHKGFLLKTFILIIALAAVLALIVATFRGSFTPDPANMDRQTFFEQFVVAGGAIVWFILLPMSFVMVYLAVEYSITIRRKKLLPDDISSQLVEIVRKSDYKQLTVEISDKDDLVSTAVAKAVNQGRGDWFRMRSLLAESLQDQAMELVRKIEWIDLIGNVSPMVGLYGTVYGMIKLFKAIVMAGGQPQPAQLADGISVALVTTFWGLSIAIPALTVCGVFRNRIETLVGDAVLEAENVMSEIIRNLKKQEQPQQPTQQQPIREIKAKSAEPLRRTSKPSG